MHSFARVLPFPGERRSSLGSGGPIPQERRLKYRYPLDLSVRFRSSSRAGSPFSATGLAINLSSGGILVASKEQIQVGSLLEMSIEWPLLLEGRIPLQLIAIGRVLRLGAACFAATFERYEFRTMKNSNPPPAEDLLIPC
ncbi:MAG TPA: PilZ domain-containing protein [Bryobacteraceae bacterium]|jgi:hypothetical protein|nr:PilZ domain-containing protein [Bryobacteraceae bacterium]